MGGKGSGGRNKKPSAQKKREGNRGHRKENKREPIAQPGEPAMPRTLSAAAKAQWKQLTPLLLKMQVLTRADGMALASLCNTHVLLQKAEAAIEKYGLICVTIDEETGVAVLKANPAVRIASDLRRQLRAERTTFGLDPASRQGLSVADLSGDDDEKDAIQALLEDSERDEVVN